MTLDGEVVPHDDPKYPYKVVFSDGADILAEWPVDSKEAGERRLQSALRAIHDQSTETMTSTEALIVQEKLAR